MTEPVHRLHEEVYFLDVSKEYPEHYKGDICDIAYSYNLESFTYCVTTGNIIGEINFYTVDSPFVFSDELSALKRQLEILEEKKKDVCSRISFVKGKIKELKEESTREQS